MDRKRTRRRVQLYKDQNGRTCSLYLCVFERETQREKDKSKNNYNILWFVKGENTWDSWDHNAQCTCHGPWQPNFVHTSHVLHACFSLIYGLSCLSIMTLSQLFIVDYSCSSLSHVLLFFIMSLALFLGIKILSWQLS